MNHTSPLPHAAMLARHLQAENAHDLEAVLATVHPETRFHDLALDQVFLGRAGAARHYQMWWQAFGNVVERSPAGETRHWLGPDNYVAEAQYRGRHDGDFLGLAPTGREIALPFTVFVSFRDGLFSAERFYYDLTTLLEQIGCAEHPSEIRRRAKAYAGA